MSDAIWVKTMPQDTAWATARPIPHLTYRQFDHWCTLGLIHTSGGGSQGRPRTTITDHEIHVLTVMADLVAAGLNPGKAEPIARQVATTGTGTIGTLQIRRTT